MTSDLLSVSSELLKDSVSIISDEDTVRIAYALWEVTIPREWARAHPEVEKVLQRHMTSREALQFPEARPLITLLSAQGCFNPLRKARYSLREIKTLFDPLRSQWYAEYYAHPAWQRLREGQASRNGLLAWLVHNYHISRAAGVVAARMAMSNRDYSKNWSSFFKQDALDEYWHCDAYYSLDTPLLKGISFEQIKAYIPLPSSLAFEEHTLRMAEQGSLGHLLIAYFQESSIAFLQDCCAFYQDVEQEYGIHQFFSPWQKHIQIDVDQGHADGLAKLFDDGREVESHLVEKALQEAWLAFYFLRSALDDILTQDVEGPMIVRSPVVASSYINSLYALLEAHQYKDKLLATIPENELTYLRRELMKSAFGALSIARTHDEIIACGRWAHRLSLVCAQSKNIELSSLNPWCVALGHHFQEAIHNPAIWLLKMSCLVKYLPTLSPGGEKDTTLQRLQNYSHLITSGASALYQLDELLTRYSGSDAQVPISLLTT